MQVFGPGRADVQFDAKKISRFTFNPEEQDWRSAKMFARYLKEIWRVVIECKFQKLPEKVAAWSDADFAGCKHARRSTSGGVVTLGNHCVRTHS